MVMVGTQYRLHDDEQGRPDARRLERTIHHRQRDFWLYQWRLDLKTGRSTEGPIDDTLNSEFSVIDRVWQGRRKRHSYHAVFPYGGREEVRFTGVTKVNHESGGFVHLSDGPNAFCNEPGFAPRDGCRFEDDGYVVTIAWNPCTRTSQLLVFDARDGEFGRGPLARVKLPRRVPAGFRATFVPQALMQRWK